MASGIPGGHQKPPAVAQELWACQNGVEITAFPAPNE